MPLTDANRNSEGMAAICKVVAVDRLNRSGQCHVHPFIHPFINLPIYPSRSKVADPLWRIPAPGWMADPVMPGFACHCLSLPVRWVFLASTSTFFIDFL